MLLEGVHPELNKFALTIFNMNVHNDLLYLHCVLMSW